MDTVTEENNLEEAEQKREEEPIAAPKASPAPVDKEPKPAAKVTRAKRGKKAKTEPVEETIAAPVEPIEDGKLQQSFRLNVGKFVSYFFFSFSNLLFTQLT